MNSFQQTDNAPMREIGQLCFLQTYYCRILEECIKNRGKTGYLQLFVDDEFKLRENTVEFIEGKFNKRKFIQINQEEPKDREGIIDEFYIYYTILWTDNKTLWNVKELVLIKQDIPNSINKNNIQNENRNFIF